MHPSYFQILNCAESDPGRDLTLSPEASEWLFSIKFWDAVNVALKSNFEQYEDDILSFRNAHLVLREFENLEHHLGDPAYVHRVSYGWTSEGDILTFSIKSADLSKEVEELKSLVRRAIVLESDVFFQL